MSRKGPNLQNIPIRTPEGRRISEFFYGRHREIHTRHGSAMDSMTRAYLRHHGWDRPPHVPSPVMDIALEGLLPKRRPEASDRLPRSLPKAHSKLPRIAAQNWSAVELQVLGKLRHMDMYDDAHQAGTDLHAEFAKILFGEGPQASPPKRKPVGRRPSQSHSTLCTAGAKKSSASSSMLAAGTPRRDLPAVQEVAVGHQRRLDAIFRGLRDPRGLSCHPTPNPWWDLWHVHRVYSDGQDAEPLTLNEYRELGLRPLARRQQ